MNAHAERLVIALLLVAVSLVGCGASSEESAAPPEPAGPTGRELTSQELRDMVVGSMLQASRGNDTAAALQRLEVAITEGKTFRMVDVADVPGDWLTVVPAGMGGGGAWEHVIARTKEQNLPVFTNGTVRATQALSRHLGKPFNAAVRVEAGNATLTALLASHELGLPILDACLSGRSRPEIQQQIPSINGLRSAPAAMVTRWGDTVIIDETVDDARLEDLGRGVAVASGGGSAIAMNVMTGRDLERGVIPGALSNAIRLGRTVREAVADGRDPVDALVQETKGYHLFRGTVTKSDGKGERGFTWWDVEIKGTHEFAGHVYRVYVKNENIVTWLDGRPDAMSPDFIANLDPATGLAHNGEDLGAYKVGADVAMIAWPSSPMWRTPNGIKAIGPRHFGFDFDYVPIEESRPAGVGRQ